MDVIVNSVDETCARPSAEKCREGGWERNEVRRGEMGTKKRRKPAERAREMRTRRTKTESVTKVIFDGKLDNEAAIRPLNNPSASER